MAFVHRVRPGECVASIATENGFFVKTLWDLPENEGLRAKRSSPYVLAEGDEVFVPDLREASMACATARRHVFRRRGVPEKFRLQMQGLDGPRAGVPYRFEVDGKERRASTDGEGWIDEWIPPRAMMARIELGDPVEEVVVVRLGDLSPADHEHGARARLAASGHLPEASADDDVYVAALVQFQADQGLPVTGTLDAATSDALRRVHGS